MSESWVNKQSVVLARTGPGEKHAVGVVVSHANFPTVGIVTEDGTCITWAEHLCEELSPEEAANYWRERALKAEKQRDNAFGLAMRAQEHAASAMDSLSQTMLDGDPQ